MRILIDVDGVLCDFATAARGVLKRMGADLPPLDQKDLCAGLAGPHKAAYWARLAEPGWLSSLAPFPGARWFVDGLRAEGHDLLFVTAPMQGRTWGSERTEWLMHHVGATRREVIVGASKFAVSGDVLIDDDERHLIAWLADRKRDRGDRCCVLPILFPQPYNAAGDHAANHLLRLDDTDPGEVYAEAMFMAGMHAVAMRAVGLGSP